MTKILFVCLGNICRSPAAEGMILHLAEDPIKVIVDSCGLGDWHVGALPDARMRKAAQERAITLSSRARCFHPRDIENFDYIFAADHHVLTELLDHAKTPELKSKVHLMTAFSKCYKNEDVPDPYLGSQADFEHVLDMLEEACNQILKRCV